MHDQTASIQAFLKATAARQTIPGGGSAVAVAGALAAAVGEMVVNSSVSNESLAAFEGELRPALAELTLARQQFLHLVVEDQAAYATLSRLRKLPADHPDRRQQLAAALLAFVRAPEATAAAAVTVLEICDRMVNFVHPPLLPDLAVCADLAMSIVRCGNYSVRANMKLVTDPADRRTIEADLGTLLTRAAALVQQVIPRIWARAAQAG